MEKKVDTILNEENFEKINEELKNYIEEVIGEDDTFNGCGTLEGVLKKDTLEEAIEMAANSIDQNGKKHSHQNNIKDTYLSDYAQKMVKIKQKIQKVKNFEELFQLAEEEGKNTHGIGEMTIYDVALRIGEYLKIYPDEIYLHRGARDGVKELFRILKKSLKGKSISKNDLPEPLRSCKLTPSQLEDFFCSVRERLKKIK